MSGSIFDVWLRAIALVAIGATTGCALPLRRVCRDGWPVKILQDPQCPRGICGYTCAPDRWRDPAKDGR